MESYAFCWTNPTVGNGTFTIAKPVHFNKMIEIASKLSSGIVFSRVDLYVINDKEYFGEITFFPNSGMGVFNPKIWDLKFGDLINLHHVTDAINNS